MATETRRQITDLGALRALADPIRYRILGHLMTVGPRTASECAVVVGATASNCSYHLRELARYGLVERVPAGDDGRERPWRPTATGFSYELAEEQQTNPVAARVARRLLHAGVDDEAGLAHAAIDRHDDLPAPWQQAETMATYGLLIDPGELTALTRAIDVLIRPYIGLTREGPPAGAHPVHVGLRAFRNPQG